MFVKLDFGSSNPLYLQIYDNVVTALSAGMLKAGDVLPSSRKLAKDLGVNYHTVNKAYNLLEIEGFVKIAKKRVKVTSVSDEDREEFIKKWNTIEAELIREAKAKGLLDTQLLELFNALLKSAEVNK